MTDPVRVAYTLEQCWHDVPGGTAVAALRVAEILADDPRVDLVAVAGRHRRPPAPPWRPPVPVRMLPVARPWLYETWLRFRWPLVEGATGPIDVCHATTIVPPATQAPLVVTVHDLAFVRTPERFTRHGARVMAASLDQVRRRADLVLASSTATLDDLERSGIGADRLRLVPLGVSVVPPTDDEVSAVRRRHDLPERFVLFVGTLEPRKNLRRLVEAVARLDPPMPLVVAGVDGWGGVAGSLADAPVDVRFVGFVTDPDLGALYAAATVFAYPSEWEGFGLPVAEAMAHGTPVVTSRGTSTEEVAGGAAVLVDAFDVDDIASGLRRAVDEAEALAQRGRERAASLTWQATADATIAAYREVVG